MNHLIKDIVAIISIWSFLGLFLFLFYVLMFEPFTEYENTKYRENFKKSLFKISIYCGPASFILNLVTHIICEYIKPIIEKLIFKVGMLFYNQLNK